MDKYYGIVAVVLLCLIIIIYIVYETLIFSIIITYNEYDFKQTKNIDTIYETFKSKDLFLKDNNGIVAYGEVPYDCLYWGITACCVNTITKDTTTKDNTSNYKENKSFNYKENNNSNYKENTISKEDTIYNNSVQTYSIKNYETIHPGEQLYIILTKNKKMFEKINKEILKEVKVTKKKYRIVQMYANRDKKYQLIFYKINKHNVVENNFSFKYRIYNFNDKIEFVNHTQLCNNKYVNSEFIDHTDILKNFNVVKKLNTYFIKESEDFVTNLCDVNLKKNEFVLIIAVDNSINGNSIFSAIFIDDKNYEIGNIYLNKIDIHNFILQTIKYSSNKDENVVVKEHIFYNPKSLEISNTIYPMSVYICSNFV